MEEYMREIKRLGLACLLLFMADTAALAGDGLNITLNNNTTGNLLVTVYDMNAQPPQKVLSSEVIYGFASIRISIAADDSGHGHLSWSATTVDRDMRRCGHHDKPKLNDGDTVHVYVNSECAAR
jgi:hypothetical protein